MAAATTFSLSSQQSLKNLFIVATGRGRTISLPRVVNTVLDLVQEKKSKGGNPTDSSFRPKLVYLGTATYDEPEPMEMQVRGYKSSCEIIPLAVSERCKEIPSKDEIQSILHQADIILVSGGNTLYAVNRWKQLGIDEIIYQAALSDNNNDKDEDKGAAVLCGGSAGAICWFAQGHSDSMDPTTFLNVDPNLTEEEKKNWKYIRVQGLGFLNALCVPHHNAIQSNGVPRSVDSNNMMLEQPDQICVGIDEEAALIVTKGSQARVVCATDKDGPATCCIKRCQAVGETNNSEQENSKDKGEYEVVTMPFSESDGTVSLDDLFSTAFFSRRRNTE